MASSLIVVLTQVLGSFERWMQPLHNLPKTPELVEAILKDIATSRDTVFGKTKECLGEQVSKPPPHTHFDPSH